LHKAVQVAVDENLASKRLISRDARFLSILTRQIGGGMRSANTILAIMKGNLELLSTLKTSFLNSFLVLLERSQMPRFIALLSAATSHDGSPIPRNQNRIVDLLLTVRMPNDEDFKAFEPADPRTVDLAEVPGEDIMYTEDVELLTYEVGPSVMLSVTKVKKEMLTDVLMSSGGQWVESGPVRFREEETIMISSTLSGVSVDVRHYFGKADALLH